VIHQAYLNGVKKLLFLGSSCIYPKMAPQPITEDALLTGLAGTDQRTLCDRKNSGIKLCEAYRAQYGDNFISAMPTNLYGPNDNYDLQGSHVLPAMIRKFWEAKENAQSEVTLMGRRQPTSRISACGRLQRLPACT
jgi:GDP-L-fucose synthase